MTVINPSNGLAITTCADATGIASVDTATLQNAINATAAGGRVLVPAGTYALDAALTITRSISIEGVSALPTFLDITGGGNSEYPETPYVAGAVFEQTAAATDIIDITGSAVTVHLKSLGLLFATGLASTGHGINASPSQTYGSGHDMGPTSFRWEDLYVYGHDGNHYAYVMLNPQYGSLVHCQSFGGGGFLVETDVGAINAGNLVFVHPYAAIFNNGTAHGFAHSAGSNSTPGTLNLLTYIRPQAIMAGATTQTTWNDLVGVGIPKSVSAVGVDLEGTGSGNPPQVGSGTQFIGAAYVTSAARWNGSAGSFASGPGAGGALAYNQGGDTFVGPGAGGAVTTGGTSTALGASALAAVTTNSGSTAIGAGAVQYNTGGNNTGVGATALQGPSGGASGGSNTALGFGPLVALTTGDQNTAIGQNALEAVTTGGNNVAVGYDAGQNNVTTGSNNTFIGENAGSSANVSDATAIGHATNASASGAVAIGVDSTGAGATATTADQFALGTANHQVQILKNATGSGSAALGANCPAVTVTAPETWFEMMDGSGNTVYIPAWK